MRGIFRKKSARTRRIKAYLSFSSARTDFDLPEKNPFTAVLLCWVPVSARETTEKTKG